MSGPTSHGIILSALQKLFKKIVKKRREYARKTNINFHSASGLYLKFIQHYIEAHITGYDSRFCFLFFCTLNLLSGLFMSGNTSHLINDIIFEIKMLIKTKNSLCVCRFQSAFLPPPTLIQSLSKTSMVLQWVGVVVGGGWGNIRVNCETRPQSV